MVKRIQNCIPNFGTTLISCVGIRFSSQFTPDCNGVPGSSSNYIRFKVANQQDTDLINMVCCHRDWSKTTAFQTKMAFPVLRLCPYFFFLEKKREGNRDIQSQVRK